MTIQSGTRRAGPYTTNGVTTAFVFTFKVFEDDDLVVTKTTAGVDTVAVLTTEYSAALNADQDNNPGGTVTFVAAPNGPLISITSAMAVEQPAVFTNTGGFYPRVLNDSLDRLTIIQQQQAETLTRTPVAPVGGGIVGQFVVVNASGGFTYANGTGADTALRTDLAGSGGAALIGSPEGGSISHGFENVRYASAYASLSLALDAVIANGGTLYITEAMPWTATLTKTLTRNIRIVHRDSPTLTYTGAGAIYGLRFITGAYRVDIVAENGSTLTLNGSDLAARILRIDNDSDIFNPGMWIEGVTSTNALVIVGRGGDANGIAIVGKYDVVRMLRCSAITVKSNYAPAVRQALVIARTSFTRGPRVVICRDIVCEEVRTFDPLTEGDTDGLVIFQNFEINTACIIDGFYSRNVQSRAIKGQNGSCVPILRNINIYRNVPSVYGGNTGTKEIDLQYGRADIDGVKVIYEGASIHNNAGITGSDAPTATTVITVDHPGTNVNGELDWNFDLVSIRNVSVVDRTTGGAMFNLFSLYYNAADTDPRSFEISGIKVNGGLVKTGIWTSSLGATQKAHILIDGLQAPFATQAQGGQLFRSDGGLPFLRAVVKGVDNTGSDELLVANAGTMSTVAFGQWIDGGGNRNVKLARGELVSSAPGLAQGAQKNLDASTIRSSWFGLPFFGECAEVRTGQTVAFGPYGDGTFNMWVKIRDYGAVGYYKVALNTVAITQVDAAGGVDLGLNNGTEPPLVGIEIGMWHDIATDQIKFKALGDSFYVTVSVFGG